MPTPNTPPDPPLVEARRIVLITLALIAGVALIAIAAGMLQ